MDTRVRGKKSAGRWSFPFRKIRRWVNLVMLSELLFVLNTGHLISVVLRPLISLFVNLVTSKQTPGALLLAYPSEACMEMSALCVRVSQSRLPLVVVLSRILQRVFRDDEGRKKRNERGTNGAKKKGGGGQRKQGATFTTAVLAAG